MKTHYITSVKKNGTIYSFNCPLKLNIIKKTDIDEGIVMEYYIVSSPELQKEIQGYTESEAIEKFEVYLFDTIEKIMMGELEESEKNKHIKEWVDSNVETFENILTRDKVVLGEEGTKNFVELLFKHDGALIESVETFRGTYELKQPIEVKFADDDRGIFFAYCDKPGIPNVNGYGLTRLEAYQDLMSRLTKLVGFLIDDKSNTKPRRLNTLVLIENNIF